MEIICNDVSNLDEESLTKEKLNQMVQLKLEGARRLNSGTGGSVVEVSTTITENIGVSTLEGHFPQGLTNALTNALNDALNDDATNRPITLIETGGKCGVGYV